VDIAMSQFSYGALASFRERGEPLPVPGGFNTAGELTTDPAAIEQSQRVMPTGFWKGSALSMVLDILAAMLSGGATTSEISTDPIREVGISQVFLAIAPSSVAAHEDLTRAARNAIEFLHASTPITPAKLARYPGENTLKLREENLRLGIPVSEAHWNAVLALAAN
jgi:3-dehydro-L-gulonate 2-dehydrogenase